MPIISNQIGNGQISAAKIVAELESRIKYVGSINAASFSDPKEIVNKAYVDAQILANIEGLDVKQSARACAPNALFALPFGGGVGAYLESVDPAFAELTVDGVALAAGDRVLVKGQGGGVGFLEAFVDDGGGTYRFTDTSEYGRFFEFTKPDGTVFYVWFDDGSAADPAGAPTPANQPTGGATGIQVSFAASALASVIVAAAKSAIDGAAVGGLSVENANPDLYLFWDTLSADNNVSDIADATGAGSMPLSQIVQIVVGDADAVIGIKNGVYVYQDTKDNTLTPNTQKWQLIRATDFDQDAEVTANAFLWVSEGTSCADTGWVLITNDPITVESTGLEWAQFNGVANLIAGEALLKTGNTLDVLYDDATLHINASNQLRLKDGGLKGIKLDDTALNAFLNGGFWMEDSPTKISYLKTTVADRKPQFAAAVALTGGITGAFQHGEVINFSGGATGTFVGLDSIITPTIMYYLPTNATVPAATNTITGVTSGATSTVNATPNNQRANTPDGSATDFALSIRDYIVDESPATEPEVTPSSLEVWRNGVLQKNAPMAGSGAVDTYELTLSSGQVTFGVAPAYGEEIIVRYVPRLTSVA